MAKLTVNTSAVNETTKATEWLRVDIRIGSDWVQVGFNALNGDYADKGAVKLVKSLGLSTDKPEVIAEQRGIKFALKSAEADTGTFDVNDLI